MAPIWGVRPVIISPVCSKNSAGVPGVPAKAGRTHFNIHTVKERGPV